MDIKAYLNIGKKFAKDNLPTILSWTGIATGGAAVVLAAKERDTQLELRNEILEEKDELTLWDEAKCIGIAYWKAALCFAVSAACGYGSNKENLKRNAAMFAALKLSEEANKDVENAILKTFGEKGASDIEKKEIEESLRSNPVTNVTIYETGKGNELFYDTVSRKYFRSNHDAVEAALYSVDCALKDDERSYNDILLSLGLPKESFGDYRPFIYSMGGTINFNCNSYRRVELLDEAACYISYELPFEQGDCPF